MYVPPKEKKNQLWVELSSFIQYLTILCHVMGDFNEIASQEEKLGGAMLPNSKFHRLNNFMNKCGLVDIPTSGNKFTWRKYTHNHNNIYEKLDRTLAQHKMLEWFPEMITHNGAFSSSDHCMITTSLTNQTMTKSQPFKFKINFHKISNIKIFFYF